MQLTTPQISRNQFEYLARKVYGICGIELKAGKEQLVQSRLSKRLTALHLKSFDEYFDLLDREPNGKELILMIDSITTNKTSFFREIEHFNFLSSEVYPNFEGSSMRIWCAAASSGEEPYSIAIQLLEELPRARSRDVKILATDISTKILSRAREATYTSESLQPVPTAWRSKHFVVADTAASTWQVRPETAALVQLGRLNLMEPWPMRGPFDIIFCRNVMIYFDKKTQERLVQRFYELIRPGGYLLVGHSESLTGADHDFKYIKPATYQK
jgi:chemotaxis protein methyltransferase CheR